MTKTVRVQISWPVAIIFLLLIAGGAWLVLRATRAPIKQAPDFATIKQNFQERAQYSWESYSNSTLIGAYVDGWTGDVIDVSAKPSQEFFVDLDGDNAADAQVISVGSLEAQRAARMTFSGYISRATNDRGHLILQIAGQHAAAAP